MLIRYTHLTDNNRYNKWGRCDSSDLGYVSHLLNLYWI